MAKILDDLKRLEEMQQRLDEEFNRAAEFSSEKAAKIAAGYASVTTAIHELRDSDSFFTETLRKLREQDTDEAMKKASTLRRERRTLYPPGSRGGGHSRAFD